jgi:S-formylglutathione hydrolase FrmB
MARLADYGRRRQRGAVLLAAFLGALLCAPVAPTAGAQEGPAAHVVRVDELSPTRSAVFVYSPAMGRVVQVQLLRPSSGGEHPTYYLLDGVDAPENESNWTQKTDITSFFADKNINVVLPVGGMGSYYTDWERPDPELGVNQWETFLTKELPPIVDEHLGGNGVNAIGGLSMGGQAALILAHRAPELYRGVVGLSVCPDISRPETRQLVRATVGSRGGDANNMWGPDTDPQWLAHDPTTNADRLRGKEIYLSVGTGLPGVYEQEISPDAGVAITEGGPLETGALVCTVDFGRRLSELGIPAEIDYRLTGTHSWPYWQDGLRDSWPTVARAVGL